MHREKAIVFILALALSLRLVFLVIAPTIPQVREFLCSGDVRDYAQLAHNLHMHNIFGFSENEPTAFRMPGYPIFLASTWMVWGSTLLPQVIQIAVDILTCYMVYLTTKSITRNRWVPLIAAAGIAINPFLILASICLLTETLTIFLLTTACFLLIQYRDTLWSNTLAAVTLGTAIYMKPTMALVAILIFTVNAVFCLRSAKNIRKAICPALIAFAVVALVMTPWIIRNYVVMKTFVPLTTSNGINLFSGNNPQADGGYVASIPWVIPGMTEIVSNRYLRDQTLAWIKSNPDDFIRLLPLKAMRFFWPLSLGKQGILIVPRPYFMGILFITILFYGFILLGTFHLARCHCTRETCIFWAIPLMLLFSTLLTFGSIRFLLPAMPALMILVAMGMDAIMQAYTRQKKKKRNGLVSAHP